MDRDDDEDDDLPEREYGTIKAPEGTWASYIRIYDPHDNVTHDMIELEDNQAWILPCPSPRKVHLTHIRRRF